VESTLRDLPSPPRTGLSSTPDPDHPANRGTLLDRDDDGSDDSLWNEHAVLDLSTFGDEAEGEAPPASEEAQFTTAWYFEQKKAGMGIGNVSPRRYADAEPPSNPFAAFSVCA
jgi:hypothetical protein